jgi:hypothetical protein
VANDAKRAINVKINGDSNSSKTTKNNNTEDYDCDTSDADSAASSPSAKPSHLFCRPNLAALFRQFGPLTSPRLLPPTLRASTKYPV